MKFGDIRDQVKDKILRRDLNSGIKSTFFPWFNRVMKGFRRGEFTVFTGPTGSGKTTLLSQLSLDFAKSGMPTLWCSFELKNEVLMSTMLNQYAGTDLSKEPHRFDYYADQFEHIPVYLQTYFGSTHVDDVLTMIDYAIYTHDVGHIIIDNLQFMLSGQGRYRERFEMQDEVISSLRKLATNHNVHVTLVIHPRKSDDKDDLSVSSIFGTAKSTQEADNVVILQNRDKYRVVDVKKNRYDGEIGKSSLWFDRGSKRFEQINAKEVEELLTGGKIGDVLERRNRLVKEDLETQFEAVDSEQSREGKSLPAAADTDRRVVGYLRDKETMEKKGNGSEEYGGVFKKFERRKDEVFRKIAGKEPHVETLDEEIIELQRQEEEKGGSRGDIRADFYSDKSASKKENNLLEEDYDMFEVKIEDSRGPIEISEQMKQGGVGIHSHSQFNEGDIIHSKKNSSENESKNIEDWRKRSLGGVIGGNSAKVITNLYEESDIIFTYDDMIGELTSDSKKKRNYTENKQFIKYTQGTENKDAQLIGGEEIRRSDFEGQEGAEKASFPIKGASLKKSK